jgi:hypothetical protein
LPPTVLLNRDSRAQFSPGRASPRRNIIANMSDCRLQLHQVEQTMPACMIGPQCYYTCQPHLFWLNFCSDWAICIIYLALDLHIQSRSSTARVSIYLPLVPCDKHSSGACVRHCDEESRNSRASMIDTLCVKNLCLAFHSHA